MEDKLFICYNGVVSQVFGSNAISRLFLTMGGRKRNLFPGDVIGQRFQKESSKRKEGETSEREMIEATDRSRCDSVDISGRQGGGGGKAEILEIKRKDGGLERLREKMEAGEEAKVKRLPSLAAKFKRG